MRKDAREGGRLADIWAGWGAYAYLAAALWAFFEGETFVLAAAALGAATGAVNPLLLMGCAWIGAFLGDQTWFYLGRRYGKGALRRVPGVDARIATARALLERHGTLFVLSFRFLYGVRNVAAAVCGLAGMNWLRFAALNFIAVGIWAASFVAAGWFLGAWIGAENLGWALLGLVVAALGGFALRVAYRRSRARAAAG